MSQESVELVHRAIAGFNERNVDAMLDGLAEDVEMRLIGGFADLMGAEFRGREGVRRWAEDWVGSLGVTAEIEQLHDLGDQVLVVVRTVGAGAATGAPVELRAAQVFSFRDQKISKVVNYYEADDALRAVGLAE